MESGSTLSRLALGALATAALVTSGGGVAAAAGNAPAGNNGTVKIDEYTVDGGHGNDPHVGCGFSVNFFGYDGGTGTDRATISVTPIAPTAGGSSYGASTSWPAGTRSSGNQYDTSIQVSGSDMSGALAGVTPQAQQGYHLRLEVEVTGSQGSDDKYKTFWMAPCGAPAGPPAARPASAARPSPAASSHRPTGTASTGAASTGAASTGAASTGTVSTGTASAGAGSTGAGPGPAAATGTAASAASGTGAADQGSTASPAAAPSGTAGPASTPAHALALAALEQAATTGAGPASTVAPLSAPLASPSLLQAVHPASALRSGSLAFTGADVEVLAGAGTVLLGLGAAAVVASRRRSRSVS